MHRKNIFAPLSPPVPIRYYNRKKTICQGSPLLHKKPYQKQSPSPTKNAAAVAAAFFMSDCEKRVTFQKKLPFFIFSSGFVGQRGFDVAPQIIRPDLRTDPFSLTVWKLVFQKDRLAIKLRQLCQSLRREHHIKSLFKDLLGSTSLCRQIAIIKIQKASHVISAARAKIRRYTHLFPGIFLIAVPYAVPRHIDVVMIFFDSA